MHSITSLLLTVPGWFGGFFPYSRRVFFLIFYFKQEKGEKPPLKASKEKSWDLHGDGEEIGTKESQGFELRKEKTVHKLIEMSRELMDLPTDRAAKNRNTSAPVCRGSSCFLHFPLLQLLYCSSFSARENRCSHHAQTDTTKSGSDQHLPRLKSCSRCHFPRHGEFWVKANECVL